MITFRRVLIPGATYFFTVNTYQRQRVLTAKPLLSGAEAKHPFRQTSASVHDRGFCLAPGSFALPLDITPKRRGLCIALESESNV